MRSFIRSAEQREALFDLDLAIAGLNDAAIERTLTELVFKVRNTLTRMWAED